MEVCKTYAASLTAAAATVKDLGASRGLSCVNRGYSMVGLSGGYATRDKASPCDAVAEGLNTILTTRVRATPRESFALVDMLTPNLCWPPR